MNVWGSGFRGSSSSSWPYLSFRARKAFRKVTRSGTKETQSLTLRWPAKQIVKQVSCSQLVPKIKIQFASICKIGVCQDTVSMISMPQARFFAAKIGDIRASINLCKSLGVCKELAGADRIAEVTMLNRASISS